MDEKLLKKLQKQSVEMARRTYISEEDALKMLIKGRKLASKKPVPDEKTDGAVAVVENVRNCAQIPATESQARPLVSLPPEQPAETDSPAKTFEQKIAEAVQSGVNADVAFQRAVRSNPAEAREYFKQQMKGEKS